MNELHGNVIWIVSFGLMDNRKKGEREVLFIDNNLKCRPKTGTGKLTQELMGY